jgi:hypothetical protein
VPRAGQVKPPVEERLSDRIALGVLTRVFPAELVDEVIAETGRAEQRHRLLPARVVVYVRHEAPRCYPRFSREELGGMFLGLMAYLTPKGREGK